MIPFDFLIGSERSGSNLITKMLDSHPDVCGPSPSHLIRPSAPQLYRYGDLRKDANWETLVSDVANLLRTKLAAWKSSVKADEILQSVAGHRLSNLIRWIYEKEAKAPDPGAQRTPGGIHRRKAPHPRPVSLSSATAP